MSEEKIIPYWATIIAFPATNTPERAETVKQLTEFWNKRIDELLDKQKSLTSA